MNTAHALRDAVLARINTRAVNGGHTYAAIREAIEAADPDELATIRQAFVRLHILQGIDPDVVPEIAEGLNRSKQVQDPSLENLRGHYNAALELVIEHLTEILRLADLIRRDGPEPR